MEKDRKELKPEEMDSVSGGTQHEEPMSGKDPDTSNAERASKGKKKKKTF